MLSFEKGIPIVQNKLRRRFNMTSSTYLCSDEFQASLTRALNLFESNDRSIKYFTLLGSLDEQLKQHTIKSFGLEGTLERCSVYVSVPLDRFKQRLRSESLVVLSKQHLQHSQRLLGPNHLH